MVIQLLFGGYSVVIRWSFGGHLLVIRWLFDSYSVDKWWFVVNRFFSFFGIFLREGLKRLP